MALGMGNYLPISGAFFDAPRRGAGLMFTSSTAERSPFPSRGRTICRLQWGLTLDVGRDTSENRRAKRCRVAGHWKTCPHSRVLSPSPRRGRGTAVAVDEVIPPAVRVFTPLRKRRQAKRCRVAGHCKSCSSLSALKPSPCRRRGTALAVDEVWMDTDA